MLWQNPQIALLSPVYPLTAFMPLQLAMKVNIVLHYWIGFAGMHLLLTRVIGVRFLPAVIYLATLVTASGAPAIHLRVGHSVFLPGFYLPLQLYFFFQAFKTGEWKYIFLAAATLALMVFNGGTHILPMSIAALGSFRRVRGDRASATGGRWRSSPSFGVAGVAYSAPKLLPVAAVRDRRALLGYAQSDREARSRDARHPEADLPGADRRRLASRLPMQRHGWHEYGNYIGLGSAALLVARIDRGVLGARRADHWFGVSLALTIDRAVPAVAR